METKKEIIQIVESLPDEAQVELLNYLKQLEIDFQKKVNLSSNLEKILSEDKELLEKLAK